MVIRPKSINKLNSLGLRIPTAKKKRNIFEQKMIINTLAGIAIHFDFPSRL